MPPHIVDLNDWQVEEWQTTPEGEERQARETAEMYEILFAHPLVEAITTWSGGDDSWLHAPAGFLRTDNSIKPSFEVLKNKILNEWFTEIKTNSDSDGNIDIEGFKGEYVISCNGKNVSFSLDGGDKEYILS